MKLKKKMKTTKKGFLTRKANFVQFYLEIKVNKN